MRYVENPSANLVSHCSGTRDGHGGQAQEHYEEMRQIVQEEIAKVIPEIYREAYAQAMNDLLQALRADITTIVDIALESGEDIFHDSKTRQALMNNLYETVIKNMQSEYTI